MNRTGHVLAAVCVTFLTALGGCGKDDPMVGGTGGTPAGGAGGGGGGAGGSGAGGSVAFDGGSDASMVDPDAASSGSYFPFAVGNSWTYLVTELNHADVTKLHVITKMELVGGTGPFKDTMAYRVETQKSSGTVLADATISWQAVESPTRIVRYRETSCRAGSVHVMDGSIDMCSVNEEDHWMPARVVLDWQPTGMAYATGLKWPEAYNEWITTYNPITSPPTPMTTTGAKTDNWEIVNADASITTPAGTFTGCAIIKKTSMAGAAKQYTYCKGVGKVKEEGASATAQTETLTKFTVQ